MSDERPELRAVPELPEDSPGLDLPPPTRQELLDAIPQSLAVWPVVDLSAEDPALDADLGYRRCIGARKAGGRCTVRAMTHSLLCPVHAGRLDSSAGGRARAEQLRNQREDESETLRLARLGTRGVIAETLAEDLRELAEVVRLLRRSASQGDLASAKLLLPYMNQGLGLPTERVHVTTPETTADLAAMPTEELAALVAQRRAARRAG